MEKQVKENLIKFIRANTPSYKTKIIGVTDHKISTITVPMWRSDDCKLTYPAYFFDQRAVDLAVEAIRKYIEENNLDLKVEVVNNYYIEIANCRGWKVTIVDAN